jgi:formate C-acetyltransferase
LKELLAANPSDAAALKKRIAICERVPESGARNFREALQAFHFSYLCTIFENPNGGNGPGRLDYFLWPYLEKDLARGTETLQSARELIDELFIRFHERHAFRGDGSVETIVVAGCDLDGKCAFNPLSRIMVESIAALKLSHPAVYIRMPDDAPEELLELAAHDVCEGGNRAQIVIDGAAIKAMTRDGHIPERDARMYMCGGCMELSPQGMNGDLLFTHFFNVLKTFEYVLTGGVCLLSGERKLPRLSKSLPDFQSFEELYAAFEEELRRELELCFACMDISSEAFEKFRPRFLLSSQTEDCAARGRVINAGGARYEDFGSTPLGIPNVADSFFAIKKAVFEKRSVEPERLLAALKSDFAEDEPLRALLEALPKYGQGDQEADAMAARVARSVCAIYEARTNRLGGKVKPMIMTFMMAPVIGAAAGASPDGRHAKRPVAQGVMPQNAALRRGGLSTAMRSANALNPGLFSGGASAMWDLDSQLAKPQLVKAIIKTFMASGGQMFQGNVCDAATLKDAQARPESYESLLVRIGGYSGRFTALDRALQGEIIERHRHKG